MPGKQMDVRAQKGTLETLVAERDRLAAKLQHAGEERAELELRVQAAVEDARAARVQLASVSERADVAEQQRFMDIVEFLPDATFVIDRDKRVVAWNHACEVMTGVKKEALLGKGDYSYAEPFFGQRRPILIDLLDASQAEVEASYKYVKRQGDVIFAESFIQRLRGGQGAHLWGEAKPLYDRAGERWGAVEVVRDVTEQKLVEQALRDSEAKYRALFATAGDAIFLMRDGRFIDCNATAATMFGCTREEIIGEAPDRFSPPLQPDQRLSSEKAQALIRQALSHGPQLFEWAHRRADGTVFPAEVSLNRIEIGADVLLLASVRDISARKLAEEQATLAARHIQYLSQYANDFIILLDDRFCLLEVNERVVDGYGYRREELLGMPAARLRAPETRSAFAAQIDGARDHGRALYETVHRRKDGTTFPVEISVRAIRTEGKTFYQAVIRDISERKRAEAELAQYRDHLEEEVRERTRELAFAKERAESADRLKSAFLATMSHELRTPLNSILGFSGILLQGLAGPLNPEQAKQLGMVYGSAEHLLALINDVLDLSKIEAGQLQLDFAPFDVLASLERTLEVVRPQAAKKGLALESDIDPRVGRITSDQRRVEQVLLNLLSNGIKFTEHGQVRLSASADGERIAVRVSDTGLGIKSEEQDRLFKPFSQLDAGINKRHEGTGLGLSICKRLIELLGGGIWVKSEWRKGSTFGFELPYAPAGER